MSSEQSGSPSAQQGSYPETERFSFTDLEAMAPPTAAPTALTEEEQEREQNAQQGSYPEADAVHRVLILRQIVMKVLRDGGAFDIGVLMVVSGRLPPDLEQQIVGDFCSGVPSPARTPLLDYAERRCLLGDECEVFVLEDRAVVHDAEERLEAVQRLAIAGRADVFGMSRALGLWSERYTLADLAAMAPPTAAPAALTEANEQLRSDLEHTKSLLDAQERRELDLVRRFLRLDDARAARVTAESLGMKIAVEREPLGRA